MELTKPVPTCSERIFTYQRGKADWLKEARPRR